MAINLTRNQIQTPSAPTVQQERQELAVVEYDIQEDRNQLTTRLENSQEVDTLVSQIEVFNLETIVSFGSEAAEEAPRKPHRVWAGIGEAWAGCRLYLGSPSCSGTSSSSSSLPLYSYSVSSEKQGREKQESSDPHRCPCRQASPESE